MVEHELRKGGLHCQVKRVETKEDFLYQLEHDIPDLILSDHGLPHFDGFTALAITRDKRPEVPFIFVTGAQGEEFAVETFESGATDYILKSNLSKLVPAIRRALRAASESSKLRKQNLALRKTEERYQMLAEAVGDYAICMLDRQGRVMSWNSGAEKTFGYRPDESLRLHFGKFYLPEEVAQGRPEHHLRRAASEGRFEEEGIRVGKGGRRFCAHVTLTILLDSGGKPRGFALVTRDITARKQAEEALVRSESLKSAILETALDAILSIDRQGRVQEWNPAAERIFGYTRAEALGRALDELIVPSALCEAYDGGLTHYLITGAGSLLGRPIQLTLHRKDQGEFPAELDISRLPTEDPPRCTAIIRDITERKRSEAALRASEERYRMLIEGVKDYAIYMLDPMGCVATWNAGAERIEGYQAEEIIGKPFSILFTPEDKEQNRPAQILEKAVTDGRCTYERWQVRKDGSRFWSQRSIWALWDMTGQLSGFSKIGRDMTEQKQAEEGLRQLAAIVNSSHDAIISTSPDGIIASWNPGAALLFGYSEAEAIGKPLAMLAPPDLLGEESRILGPIQCGQMVSAIETVRRSKDGRLVDVSVTISPIKDASGEVIGSSHIARDITATKQAEERIRQLNEELEQRVRDRTAQLQASNDELKAFTYSVSHDLRAPVRHILGYVGILESEATARLDDSVRANLQTIGDSARQMNQLIEALLKFSRLGRVQMHFERVSLAALLKEAQHALRTEIAGRDIEWRIGELPEVRGDPMMLRQVWVNLLSNALKYTRERSRARIEIGSQTALGQVVCFIRDNGAGFSMDYAHKLFGVFQRLHRQGEFEGTGIGLANVRRIIARHGGRTWAEGALDRGATFHFSLPASLKNEAS